LANENLFFSNRVPACSLRFKSGRKKNRLIIDLSSIALSKGPNMPVVRHDIPASMEMQQLQQFQQYQVSAPTVPSSSIQSTVAVPIYDNMYPAQQYESRPISYSTPTPSVSTANPPAQSYYPQIAYQRLQ
jgi:hypothetical protein